LLNCKWEWAGRVDERIKQRVFMDILPPSRVNVILMSAEKQKFMATKVTRRHVFLHILTHVTCEMYRELSVKNLMRKEIWVRHERKFV
jgi:hypothetical protein